MAIVVLPEANKRGKYKTRNDSQGIANRTIDGIVFDSAKEARRYAELKLLARANEITELKRQWQFELKVNGIVICNYRCDFSYFKVQEPTYVRIVEDVKGMKTPIYKLKKKLMKAIWSIDISEI